MCPFQAISSPWDCSLELTLNHCLHSLALPISWFHRMGTSMLTAHCVKANNGKETFSSKKTHATERDETRKEKVDAKWLLTKWIESESVHFHISNKATTTHRRLWISLSEQHRVALKANSMKLVKTKKCDGWKINITYLHMTKTRVYIEMTFFPVCICHAFGWNRYFPLCNAEVCISGIHKRPFFARGDFASHTKAGWKGKI